MLCRRNSYSSVNIAVACDGTGLEYLSLLTDPFSFSTSFSPRFVLDPFPELCRSVARPQMLTYRLYSNRLLSRRTAYDPWRRCSRQQFPGISGKALSLRETPSGDPSRKPPSGDPSRGTPVGNLFENLLLKSHQGTPRRPVLPLLPLLPYFILSL